VSMMSFYVLAHGLWFVGTTYQLWYYFPRQLIWQITNLNIERVKTSKTKIVPFDLFANWSFFRVHNVYHWCFSTGSWESQWGLYFNRVFP
jgi:hypothetical protein